MIGLGRAARSIDARAVQVTAPDPDGQPDTYQKPLAKETATAVRTALLKAWRPSLSIESGRKGVLRLPTRLPSRSSRLANRIRGNCRPQSALQQTDGEQLQQADWRVAGGASAGLQ